MTFLSLAFLVRDVASGGLLNSIFSNRDSCWSLGLLWVSVVVDKNALFPE